MRPLLKPDGGVVAELVFGPFPIITPPGGVTVGFVARKAEMIPEVLIEPAPPQK